MSDFQSLDFTSYHNQIQSPLFSILPPEIRHDIYVYALSEYEIFERSYSKNTYWWRPGNTAVRRTATELLRTCRRLYNEAWLMQFALAEHRFYLTQSDRSPGGTWPRGFREYNRLVHETYGKHQPGGRSGLGGIRVFAQLWMLEPGHEPQKILDVPLFYPKRIAVTIRCSDFWFWENNTPLHVGAAWVNEIRLPNSVTHFTVDFEMIERRKDEVNLIANDAVEKWFYKRQDGAILTARKEDISVSTWTGSSILGGRRWVRDEIRPGQLDYHVVTVTWKLRQRGDCPHPCPNLDVPRDFVQVSPPFTQTDSIDLRNLQNANVSLDTPAAEAWREMQQYYESAHQETETSSGDEPESGSDEW